MEAYTEAGLFELHSWRYATKIFQKGATIGDETWQALEQSLVLTPSSYGLQPWKFIIITNPEIKRSLRPHTLNQAQVEDCSHLVVFCALEKLDDRWVKKYIDRYNEIRGPNPVQLEKFTTVVHADLINGYRKDIAFEWACRQVYIALGNFMTSAATLSVDTCAMEGFFPDQFDKVLGLTGSGFRSVVCCAAGYRSENDMGADLPKVRFAAEEVIDRR